MDQENKYGSNYEYTSQKSNFYFQIIKIKKQLEYEYRWTNIMHQMYMQLISSLTYSIIKKLSR